MSTADLASFTALADSTARNLARESITNRELREAIQTVPLGVGAVRIGGFDILSRELDHDVKVYDVRANKTNRLITTDIVYYETARMMVSRLNDGESAAAMPIQRLIRYNEEYSRLLADIATYGDRMRSYYEVAMTTKANIMEDRLDAAQAKAEILRERLLTRDEYN